MIKTIVVLILFSTNFLFANIDTTLVKNVDVTGDGILDTISLNIQAESYSKVYKFNFSIYSLGNLIYSYSGDDSNFNDMFTKEYFPSCKTVSLAKREYYFKTFMGFKIERKIDFGDSTLLFKKDYSGSIYQVAHKFLTANSKLSQNEIKLAINKAIEKLKKGKALIIFHSKEIIDSSLPLMYFPEIKKLVPIYSD